MRKFIKGQRKINILDISTICLGLVIVYFAWCFIDTLADPIDTEVTNVTIEHGYNTGKIKSSYLNENSSVKLVDLSFYVKPGDTIHVEFTSNRKRNGEMRVDRIFSIKNREYVTYSINRIIGVNEEFKTVAEYKIPLFIKSGCDAAVFSRGWFEPSYNIIASIRPIILETPKIKICVEESSRYDP